jgi:hypothetical protein
VQTAGPAAEGVFAISVLDPTRMDPKWRIFQQNYRRRFDEVASPNAAYAYDGMTLLIAAIEEAGLNRGRIMDLLRKYQFKEYQGGAGPMQFGSDLSNISPLIVSRVEGGDLSTGHLSYPYQLALDSAGNMYVGNYVQNNAGPKVVKIPAGGGTASVVSTSPVTLGTSITGVAVDGAGNLFIADYYNTQIVVVTPLGAASILSISGLSPALGEPTELAFDGAGNLYIGDYAANGRSYSRVVEVSSLFVLGSTSRGIGTVINTGSYTFSSSTITGVTVGSNGTVYIAARTSNSSHVVQVTAAGVASLLNPNGISFTDPQGVFVDGMGNLYVENSGNHRKQSSREDHDGRCCLDTQHIRT